MSQHIMIIGSGMAGYIVAQEIRALSQTVQLTMITEDAGEYYSKPSLSNALRMGKKPEMLVLKSANDMASELDMCIKCHQTVQAVEPQHKRVVLASETLSYDALIFATGSRCVYPAAIEYRKKPMVVNTLDDFRRLYQRLSPNPSQKTAVLGAGLVGTEVALDMRNFGAEVDWIYAENWPMSRFVPEEVGMWLRDNFAQMGISPCHEAVSLIDERDGQYLVHTEAGVREYETVVQAFGLVANDELAAQAGVQCDGGIVVDHQMRTSVADHYAIGDCMRALPCPLFYVRPIRIGAKVLAANILGGQEYLQYPPMVTNVKSGDAAIAFSLSPMHQAQAIDWDIRVQSESGVQAHFYKDKKLCGFVVCGDQAVHKNELAQEMANWLGE